MTRCVAAIAGRSAAGKTRFAHALAGRLGDAVVLSQDDYYRDTAHLTPEERAAHDFDQPETLDLDGFAAHLEALGAGRSVPRWTYGFATGVRRVSGSIAPARFVIAEGLYALRDRRVREMADLRVFLDGDTERLIERRIRRDIAERGHSPALVRHRAETMVLPAERRYLAGTERFAHLVFPMDWGDAEVARAAARLAGDTPRPETDRKGPAT